MALLLSGEVAHFPNVVDNRTVEGVYRNGRIELEEEPDNIQDETRVIVTFLSAGNKIDLRLRGVDEARAADLRARLSRFAEDWDSPEMDVYDDYDANRP